MHAPLAERMRPQSLDDFIGQDHLIGPEGILRPFLNQGVMPSLLFWGPPGVGKTTLAGLLAQGRPFHELSAVHAGVKEVREVLNRAKQSQQLFENKTPILFIDEIHRFSKSQQDSLLGAVEKGWITLIGATTENPSFEVIPALRSRCQLYTLESLSKKDLTKMIQRALDQDKQLKNKSIKIKETEALFRLADGDARRVLNLLELCVNSQQEEQKYIDDSRIQQVAQKQIASYDKNGEQHYDIISAFIKSVRGSDPNAAVYWLARMLEGGEDIKFIARRLVILASEDIGNANPTALVLANSCFQVVNNVGLPEARIPLSQCTIYLASSPKSNSSYTAIKKAQQLVIDKGNLSVPLSLRNAPTQLMKDLNYGKNYEYAHDHTMSFVDQEFLPEEISGASLYKPGKNVREQTTKEFLQQRWKNKYHF